MVKRFFIPWFLFILPFLCYSGEIKQMEFINQPVKDILFTLAGITNTSIITDDTVQGNASYHFSNTDLDSALKHFLSLYNLHFIKKDGIYYVSRIFVSWNSETKTISVCAKDIQPRLILEKISGEIHKTILFDSLPDERISINALKLPVFRVLEMIMHRFDMFIVENLEDYYYVKHKPAKPRVSLSRSMVTVTESKGLFSISAGSVHLTEALSRLFSLSDHEYSLLKRSDTV